MLFAFALTVVLGMTALVADIGLVAAEKSKFQNAIDAAALAAAHDLPNTATARNTAKQLYPVEWLQPFGYKYNFFFWQ